MYSLNRFGDKSLSYVKRSLNFDEAVAKPSEAKPDRFQNGKKRLSIARRRLDFGESEPSVLLSCPDVLPSRDDPDEEEESFRVKRTCFTFKQKTMLEELFQKKKFLNRNEKTRLALELGVTKLEIQMWFEKRRQQWKKQHQESQVVDSRPCVLQTNPQTPFPRPFQNVVRRVTIATVQSSADGSDSIPGLLHNLSDCCLCTPERAAKSTKFVSQFLRQE